MCYEPAAPAPDRRFGIYVIVGFGQPPIIADLPRTDTAIRVISAPIADVYSALVDPEALAVWLPPGDMNGTIERFDLRPGGSYRMVLQYPDRSSSQGKTTSDTDVVEARFVDLVPNSRVVWAVDFVSDDPAYDDPMIMRWEVTATNGGTCVEITAEHVPDAVSEEDHAAGMESSLAKLDEYLARLGHLGAPYQ